MLSTPVKPGSPRPISTALAATFDIWFDDEQVMERGKFLV